MNDFRKFSQSAAGVVGWQACSFHLNPTMTKIEGIAIPDGRDHKSNVSLTPADFQEVLRLNDGGRRSVRFGVNRKKAFLDSSRQ